MSTDINGCSEALEKLRSRKSVIREIPVSEIVVDKRFQRPVNPNAVEKIEHNYHPQGLGYVLVAHVYQEDGTLGRGWSVIDGQTRCKALEELRAEGKPVPETITAEAFDELTAAEAAALFGLRNGQRPVPPADRDRVLRYAGDPMLREIVEAASAVGYIVFRDDPDNEPAPTMPHLTEAKRILGWGLKYDRPELLGLTLSIQAQAFGTKLGDCDKQVLSVTADLLLKNPHLDEAELVRVLGTNGIPSLVARGQAEAAKLAKRAHAGTQKVIADDYNKAKTKDERIDWRGQRLHGTAGPELTPAEMTDMAQAS